MADTFNSIQQALINEQKRQFGPSINVSSSSNNMKFCYPIISAILDKSEALQYYKDMRNVYKAEGYWLDLLLSNYHVLRKQAAASKVTWTSYDSTPGTFVDAGELQLKYIDGVVFANTEPFTVDEEGYFETTLTCLVKGAYNVPVGSLTTLIKPVAGIGTGTNETAGYGGQFRETDLQYRIRFLSGRAGVSYWNRAGLEAALRSLDGVSSVYVEENDTAATVGALPPHSLRIVVDGGSDYEIAHTILTRGPISIQKVGNTVVEVEDLDGTVREIYFYRPDEVQINYLISVVGTVDEAAVSKYVKEYLDNSGVHATISRVQAMRYVQERVSLSDVQVLDIDFKRAEDTTYVGTITLAATEKAVGVASA